MLALLLLPRGRTSIFFRKQRIRYNELIKPIYEPSIITGSFFILFVLFIQLTTPLEFYRFRY